MKNNLVTALALFTCFCTSSVIAADTKSYNAIVAVISKTIEIKPGQTKDTTVRVKVSRTYHLQANPPSEDYLIPTKIIFKNGEYLSVSSSTYPQGKKFRLQGSNSDLLVYDGIFDITQKLTANSAVLPGSHYLEGELRYQACDDKVCLPPSTLKFKQHIHVSK